MTAVADVIPLCRNRSCGKPLPDVPPRGLCPACEASPGVRGRYRPPTSLKKLRVCRSCSILYLAWCGRGLCTLCYRDAEIRRRFPPVVSTANTSAAPDFYGEGAAGAPTDARPGTLEKVEVMAARASRLEGIFQAGDYVEPRPATRRRTGLATVLIP
jgi:hypothetical protein